MSWTAEGPLGERRSCRWQSEGPASRVHVYGGLKRWSSGDNGGREGEVEVEFEVEVVVYREPFSDQRPMSCPQVRPHFDLHHLQMRRWSRLTSLRHPAASPPHLSWQRCTTESAMPLTTQPSTLLQKCFLAVATP